MKRPFCVATPSGSFWITVHPDGSIQVKADKGTTPWLDHLLWKFLLEWNPRWSASCETGQIVIRPPET